MPPMSYTAYSRAHTRECALMQAHYLEMGNRALPFQSVHSAIANYGFSSISHSSQLSGNRLSLVVKLQMK